MHCVKVGVTVRLKEMIISLPIKVTYKWGPCSVFAPEGHLDGVLMSCSLVKGLAGLKRRTVQVQTHRTLCVTDVLHAVQADGV